MVLIHMKMALTLLLMTLSLFLVEGSSQSCPPLYIKSSSHPAKVQAGKYSNLDIKLNRQKRAQAAGLVLKVTLPDGLLYVSSGSKKENGGDHLLKHGADLYFKDISASFKAGKFQIKVCTS